MVTTAFRRTIPFLFVIAAIVTAQSDVMKPLPDGGTVAAQVLSSVQPYRLAKTAADSNDSLLSRIDIYSDYNYPENSGWHLIEQVTLSYDDRNRITTVNKRNLLPDVLTWSFSAEYSQSGGKITLLREFGEALPNHIRIQDEYFISDTDTRTCFCPEFFEFSILSLDNIMPSAVDSVVSTWYEPAGPDDSWEATHKYRDFYSYEGNFTTMRSESFSGDTFKSSGTSRYIYSFNENGRVVKSTLLSLNSATEEWTEIRSCRFTYENGVVRFARNEFLSENLLDVEVHLEATYTPEGRLSTCIQGTHMLSEDTMYLIEKREYVYMAASRLSDGATRQRLTRMPVSFTVRNGCILISTTPATAIKEVTLFDLQGRVIFRRKLPASRRGEPVSVEAPSGNRVGLIDIRTDRGRHTCTIGSLPILK